jgi:hypothetical protein
MKNDLTPNKLKTENTISEVHFLEKESSEDDNLITQKVSRRKNKEIEMTKSLPSVFFVLFLLIFCLILLRFVPSFCNVAKSNHFYLIKSSVKYFSEYFSDESSFTKVNNE